MFQLPNNKSYALIKWFYTRSSNFYKNICVTWVGSGNRQHDPGEDTEII